MKLSRITRMIRDNDFSYIFGRFYSLRKLYSFYRSINFSNQAACSQNQQTVFKELSLVHAINSIKMNSVALNFNLPSELVDKLIFFAETQYCTTGKDDFIFKINELREGNMYEDNLVVMAFVTKLNDCPIITNISNDPLLLQTVSAYLGYTPKNITSRLFWSLVVHVPDDYRLEHWQTVKYHFDSDGYNFIYANFYLTDVDKDSGAHVMIQGSHKNKPLKMLFNSANQPDDTVLNYYGVENELTIEGKAGTGFVQDSSCYHKALAPVKQRRLMLQLRFK